MSAKHLNLTGPYHDSIGQKASGPKSTGAALFLLSIMATLTIEHSPLDVRISQFFYHNHHWIIEKGEQPYAFILYDFPKLLLILMSIYLIAVFILQYRQASRSGVSAKPLSANRLIWPKSRLETSFLLAALIVVPSTIATLKSLTHVSCPNHLLLFNGDLPYLSIWQSILAKIPNKCFPAAHASAGFSMYALAYLPSLSRHKFMIIAIVSLLGWTMGLYKMLFGDHFFSHTLVSMLLSWSIVCGLSTLFFSKACETN